MLNHHYSTTTVYTYYRAGSEKDGLYHPREVMRRRYGMSCGGLVHVSAFWLFSAGGVVRGEGSVALQQIHLGLWRAQLLEMREEIIRVELFVGKTRLL